MYTLNFTANNPVWFSLSSPFSAESAINLPHLIRTSGLSVDAAAIIKSSQEDGYNLVAVFADHDGVTTAVFNERVLADESDNCGSFEVRLDAKGKVIDWRSLDQAAGGFSAVN